MDGKRNKRRLEDFKFLEFYRAIGERDYKSLGLTEEEFGEYQYEFFVLVKGKPTGTKKEVEKLQVELNIYTSCYLVLLHGWNDDIVDTLKSRGIEIEKGNTRPAIEKMLDRVEKLNKRIKMLSSTIVEQPVRETEMSGHDVLANLFMGLEFAVPFDQVSVGEYVSYQKTLKKKADALKNRKHGRRTS